MVELYFNLTTRENNKLTFSCNTIINNNFLNYVLTVTQDQATLSVTEFSDGDGVVY